MSFTSEDKGELKKLELIGQIKIKTNDKLKGKNDEWKNFCENLNNSTAWVVDFSDEESVARFMAKIDELNAQKAPADRIIVRLAAGGKEGHDLETLKYSDSYSISDGVTETSKPTDIIVRLPGFQKIEMVEGVDDIICVGAGVQIRDLDNVMLNKFHKIPLTGPLINKVTGVGLITNAGHGTGRLDPSFAGLVTAMRFCLPDGKIVRIRHPDENSPKREGDLELTAAEFEAIRGANLGLFGILLDVEMKVKPAKKLKRRAKAMSLAEFLDHNKQKTIWDNNKASVMYVPTYREDELTNTKIKNVVVYTFEEVDMATPDSKSNPDFEKRLQEFEVEMQERLHINELLKECPSLIPFYMRYFVAKISVENAESEMVGPWDEIYHYQTAFPKQINDIDCLFEVSPDYHEVADSFRKFAENLGECAKHKEYPVDFAAYARLIKGTNGGLSTSCKNDPNNFVCGFDIVSQTPELKGYAGFKRKMMDYFLGKLKAKPHWGKFVPDAKTVDVIMLERAPTKDDIKDLKGNGKFAYVFSGHDLHYVDKRNKQITKIDMAQEKIEDIKNKLHLGKKYKKKGFGCLLEMLSARKLKLFAEHIKPKADVNNNNNPPTSADQMIDDNSDIEKGIDYEEMYGASFKEFNHMLDKWYEINKLDIKRSPFFNKWHADILKRPDLVPAPVPKIVPFLHKTKGQERNATQFKQPVYSKQEQALKDARLALAILEKDADPSAKELLQQIKIVLDQKLEVVQAPSSYCNIM